MSRPASLLAVREACRWEDPPLDPKDRAVHAGCLLYRALRHRGTLYQSEAVDLLHAAYGDEFVEPTPSGGWSVSRRALHQFRRLSAGSEVTYQARRMRWVIGRRKPDVPDWSGAIPPRPRGRLRFGYTGSE